MNEWAWPFPDSPVAPRPRCVHAIASALRGQQMPAGDDAPPPAALESGRGPPGADLRARSQDRRMPESPEVQALVEFLDERIEGRVIAALDIGEFRIVKTRDDRPPASLVGARITGIRRFGKHVGFETTA